MNGTIGRSIIGIMLALVGLGTTAVGQEARFFRIVSTQQIHTVSLNRQGILSWVNSVSEAPCRVETCATMNGTWTTNFPITLLQSTGLVGQVRVPLFAKAGEILVGFQDNVSEAQANRLLQSYGLVWESHFPRLFAYWVKVLSGAPADHLLSLTATNMVMWAEPRGKPEGEAGAAYILVQFNLRATQETAQQFIASIPGLQLDSLVTGSKWGLVYVPAGTERRWMAEIRTHPEVRYTELNGILTVY